MLKIDKANYQGYIWYSDSKVPQVIDGEFSLQIEPTHNPFVLEGMLYNIDTNESMSIRYIDGEYITGIHKVNENDLNSNDVDICEYMPHRMPGIDRLLFLQYWEPVEDTLCCGMETLVPTKKVFIGFKK